MCWSSGVSFSFLHFFALDFRLHGSVIRVNSRKYKRVMVFASLKLLLTFMKLMKYVAEEYAIVKTKWNRGNIRASRNCRYVYLKYFYPRKLLISTIPKSRGSYPGVFSFSFSFFFCFLKILVPLIILIPLIINYISFVPRITNQLWFLQAINLK